jgi:CubicO group peptidase (beta-lactamase class C family)
METEPQNREMTIRDLMRHTSGLTYGFFGDTPVDKAYRDGGFLSPDLPLDDFVKRLAAVPLLAQPGEKWIYSVSVDVQGYLVEYFSGMKFDAYLEQKIFAPLGMTDTGFYVPEDKKDRFVQIYTFDKNKQLVPASVQDFTQNTTFKSGGGGLVSTTEDYWKFAQMLLGGGQYHGIQLLKPETVELMAQNHLPEQIKGLGGENKVGFGLNFSVLQNQSADSKSGSNGTFAWGGMANTVFWIDPKEELIVLFMTNILPSGVYPFRQDMKDQIYPIVNRSAED